MELPNLNGEEEQQDTSGLDYPLKEDGIFTADDQEAIVIKREQLDNEVKNKQAFLKVVEIAGINLSCHAIARMIVLYGGYSQLWFAAAFVLLVQQIQNRDVLSNFNLDYNEGWKMNSGQSIFKILFTLVSTGVVMYLSCGDIWLEHQAQIATYEAYKEQIKVFNEAPQSLQETYIKMFIGGGAAVLIVLIAYKKMFGNNNDF